MAWEEWPKEKTKKPESIGKTFEPQERKPLTNLTTSLPPVGSQRVGKKKAQSPQKPTLFVFHSWEVEGRTGRESREGSEKRCKFPRKDWQDLEKQTLSEQSCFRIIDLGNSTKKPKGKKRKTISVGQKEL